MHSLTFSKLKVIDQIEPYVYTTNPKTTVQSVHVHVPAYQDIPTYLVRGVSCDLNLYIISAPVHTIINHFQLD